MNKSSSGGRRESPLHDAVAVHRLATLGAPLPAALVAGGGPCLQSQFIGLENWCAQKRSRVARASTAARLRKLLQANELVKHVK